MPFKLTLPRWVRLWRLRINRRARSEVVDIRRRVAMVGGAVLLGLVALAFAAAGDHAQQLIFRVTDRVWWLPILITPAAFALIVWTAARFFSESRGSGIPQIIAAGRRPDEAVKGPLVSLRTAIAKLGLTLATLAAGGSVGREGPTVQVSAAIMVAVHRLLKVRVTAGVFIAGGAAGVAAAFNTPLAGIAFAIEELASAYEQRVAVLTMGAVMIAGLVSLAIAGDYVYFGVMRETLPVADVLIIAPVAGVGGGLAGGLFARIVLAASARTVGWARYAAQRPVVFAAGCGLVVAVVGVATNGGTWGTGYDVTRFLVEGNQGKLWFFPAKFAAALASTLSGAPGGIFAPSLAVGAGFGNLLTPAFPESPAGAVVMMGMVAYFVGVVRAPLTAVIILIEATAARGVILPLFMTALIADWTSAQICPTRLYHGLAMRMLPGKSAAA
ncbi:chloride channel protein [Sphingopyxis sp. H115]|uniref:chloride channel protein n=1 Tax=Sphingopyxis sp. H115 TaxID=1759073 RepID=UPI00073606EF|nr:chloride channel protein [Sphingopyxis sp. H115]KTE17630.1 chloride channel protein [Sphingopyxis sp. H115]